MTTHSSQIYATCRIVDTQLNSNIHTLRRSNALHKAKLHSRSVIAAAKKINKSAKAAQLSIAAYIALAIDATLLKKRQLNIGSIAAATIRKKVVRHTKDAVYHSPHDFPTMDPSLPPEEILGAMIAARTELDPATLICLKEVQQGLREGLISIDQLTPSELRTLLKKMS